ncbi:hypothetical protein A2962_01355 [Candidatus Woesebacteria bacterium RIFCSPLOWO2_01_FULL_39_61]|uniref:Uncharacterized protein n=1 Tax=Candidatus Woesebacteria bacterium RIFCSPHIGHO2_02_FULL_39_13 TaxID=1802505 RepID=A0A1F7Z4M4_9BACT|nr:MAG: hypothetical protein A2692_01595 [Candidatus Woesebacteria bacterium RIFCSPHIGHO2_01_FULL_39_95]OGM34497.1 MAG: hypothetical protein A3D01_03050 [Candidatus Woesebacteria bacterium RIFCSPHIGHO2_02_FULL_39_13]OGM38763.1 MAG: hypothetical protein A3E13_00940 [Candidatus Woesebacteria bacterium RIFCSPHIGHO2_12_FULL_40_20]OGM65769.1 MAG: hypothetical protein A2962_01355 [Candidatus Woesebacteria bacterium RIFCSPLOWO2_01_FULL_39_61]OGM72028.1 MAG: hypothetical protein A3H19_04245 [Candidatus
MVAVVIVVAIAGVLALWERIRPPRRYQVRKERLHIEDTKLYDSLDVAWKYVKAIKLRICPFIKIVDDEENEEDKD